MAFPGLRFAISAGALVGLGVASGSMAQTAVGDQSPTVSSIICERIGRDELKKIDPEDRDAVKAYYTERNCRPVWTDETGPTRSARLAAQEISHAADWGLDANDFRLSAWIKPLTGGRWTSAEAADSELEITGLVLRYAHQAQGGRIPEPSKQLSSYLDRAPAVMPTSDVLARVTVDGDPGAVLRSYQPHQDQFLKLKTLLGKLRGDGGKADVVAMPARGPNLDLGTTHPDVAILKRRLGVASKVGSEQVFDDALDAAVKAFQEANDLTGDGIVGPRTRRALAPASQADGNTASKLKAVLANMEEWRWMPPDLGDSYVLVNVPSFSIKMMSKGVVLFEDRVIVGTQSTQTPIFSKNMTSVVLRPEWNLPDSIKISKLMSRRSIESQGYVVKRNGHVVSSSRINWGRANIREYTISQPSGDDNALGLVKLLFPNKHSVYLHDTPSRSLFNSSVRLFSHGCMRVRNPQDFAQDVLDSDRGVGALDVKTLVKRGPRNNDIALDTPLPVHVGYFTVWIADDGTPAFYPDYYGHQKRIELALAKRWKEIDVGVDHLAAIDTSILQEVRFDRSSDRPSKKHSSDDDNSPSGLTNNFAGYRSSGRSVGDLIRQSLGN